jgi:glutamate racemase
MGCPLVILACNTASARALRTIQQQDLPRIAPHNRVLGIIRPTAGKSEKYRKTGHIGIVGTVGTVVSGSYPLEINIFSGMVVSQQACPMWVPLVENGEFESEGARYFVRRDIVKLLTGDPRIDTLLLACTHYPFWKSLSGRNFPWE